MPWRLKLMADRGLVFVVAATALSLWLSYRRETSMYIKRRKKQSPPGASMRVCVSVRVVLVVAVHGQLSVPQARQFQLVNQSFAWVSSLTFSTPTQRMRGTLTARLSVGTATR
jgi:hypothetical protein